MGYRLLPHRLCKAQRRGDLRLSEGHPAAHDRRQFNEPTRRTPALELAQNTCQPIMMCDRRTLTSEARICKFGCRAGALSRGEANRLTSNDLESARVAI